MRDGLKRGTDSILAAAGLLVFFPLGVGAAVICALSGEGVFYCQRRVGRAGKSFQLYKFRTMRRETPTLPRSLLRDAEKWYIPGGKFLRSTGIDELPQLINVLRGEMSLIGPRPLLEAERQIHRLRQKAGVYALRPGITGLAQLCGDPKPQIKAALDAIYLKEGSLMLDIAITLSTLRLLAGRRREKGKNTTPEIVKFR